MIATYTGFSRLFDYLTKNNDIYPNNLTITSLNSFSKKDNDLYWTNYVFEKNSVYYSYIYYTKS